MKIKIKNQESMHISGVVFYGDIQRLSHKNYGSSDYKWQYQSSPKSPDLEGLKNKASRLTDEMLSQIKHSIGNFGNTQTSQGDGHPQSDKTQNKGDGHPNFTFNEGDQRMNNFEGAMNKLGEMMTSLGHHIENNAKKWDESAQDWSKNFESKAEEFGERMEAWGEEFGTKMEAWGKEFEKMWEGSAHREEETFKHINWIQDYPIFETFNRLHDHIIMDHPDYMEKNHFYEVQMYDMDQLDDGAMTLVGSRLKNIETIPAPIVSMTFNPDRWLVVKMTDQEYQKDWLKSLEKSETLVGYEIEPYMMIKHDREAKEDMIKIYCPLKVKGNE